MIGKRTGRHRAATRRPAVGKAVFAAAVCLAAPLAGTAVSAQAAPAAVDATTAGVVYNNVPSPLPGNLPSEAFEAQSASEFGGVVSLAGTSRTGAVVTVIMSSWGCESGSWYQGNCVTTPGSTFTEPITLNVYQNTGGTTDGSAPGPLVTSVTKTFAVPYRPSADSRCTGGKWYSTADAKCYNGFDTPIQFVLPASVTLPDSAIVSVAYNTSDYGAQPQRPQPCNTAPGGCGYDSLNVALTAPPTVGSLPAPDDAYVSSTWSGAFCNGQRHTGFVRDTGCWTGYQPAIRIQAATATNLVANPSVAKVTLTGGLVNLRIDVPISVSGTLTTADGTPVQGEPVTFSAAGQTICTAVTDSAGKAACAGLLTAVLPSVLSLGYTATFAGDGVLQPSSAHGPLVTALGITI